MLTDPRVMSLSSLRHKIALFHCLESAAFHLLEGGQGRRRDKLRSLKIARVADFQYLFVVITESFAPTSVILSLLKKIFPGGFSSSETQTNQ